MKSTSKFNKNLDNIKLGNNKGIYNSSTCPGEVIGVGNNNNNNNNKYRSNYFETKNIKVLSEIQDKEEKEAL